MPFINQEGIDNDAIYANYITSCSITVIIFGKYFILSDRKINIKTVHRKIDNRKIRKTN